MKTRHIPGTLIPRFSSMLIVFVFAAVSGAANQPPAVDAGPDTLVGTNDAFFLSGTVTPGTVPAESLALTWTQVSAPDSAVGLNLAAIASPATPYTRVRFAVAGAYVFKLSVSDGMHSVFDTVKVTVRKSLPFLVLTPANNARVKIGASCTLRWQMDPSKPCRISLSLDNGRTYAVLSLSGAVTDSFVWNVDSSYADSTPARLRTAEYGNAGNYAEIAILLVKTPARVAARCAGPAGGAFSVAVDNAGALEVSGPAGISRARIAVFDAGGRIMLSGALRRGRTGGVLCAPRPLLYRVTQENGTALGGKVGNER